MGSEKNLESCDKKSKNEVGFEPGACRDFFRAGLYGRAGRRSVGPVQFGGFPGPERLLIRTRHRVQYRFLEASGVSGLKNCNNFFCKYFVLKIGPDWGIFSRANIGGKDSLRHELPHTQNPGLVRATVLPVDSFWCVTSKLPRDFGLERAL